jgi:hypothetical protein
MLEWPEYFLKAEDLNGNIVGYSKKFIKNGFCIN